jgi:hypothetical protein
MKRQRVWGGSRRAAGLALLVVGIGAGCSLDQRTFDEGLSDSPRSSGGAAGAGVADVTGLPAVDSDAMEASSGATGEIPAQTGSTPLSPGVDAPATMPEGQGPAPAPASSASLAAALAAIDFESMEAGVASAAQTWVVTNEGQGATTNLTLSNNNPNEFPVTGACPAVLEPGASCTLSMRFAPTGGGPRTGRLELSDGAATVSLDLTGQGLFRVSFSFEGAGRGRVTSPSGVDCAASCDVLLPPGRPTFTASTENGSGSYFAGWSQQTCSGPLRDCVVNLAGPVTISVRFSAMTNNLIFVSSRNYPPDLGGLDAYDRECNALASAAGINDLAGTAFVAGMNDSATSMADRVGNARGWVRIDGLPIADSAADLVGDSPVVRHGVAFTELGVGAPTTVWTGANGLDDSASCADWTDASSSYVTLGSPYAGPDWLFAFAGDCSGGPLPIYCIGRTLSAPLAPLPLVEGKRIWVSNGLYVPGTVSPDTQCTTGRPAGVAEAAALVAYTDRAASDLIDPLATYVRPDGQRVGTGVDVLEMTLTAGLWVLGDGNMSNTFNPLVWAGADNPSTPGTAATTCSDWQTTNGTADVGLFGFSNQTAWHYANVGCDQDRTYLYCIEL